MNPRELVILILGLAIVVVVMRGLFVALRSRRGQIRLAIDKNIPRDVDLNALELAELPSGGARVVARSFAAVNKQNHVVAKAATNAAALELGTRSSKAESIPVLMDPVNLQTASHHSLSKHLATAPAEEEIAMKEAVSAVDADSVLFDYDARSLAVDNLSQVTPDYPDDDDSFEEDDFDDDFDDELEDDSAEDDRDYEDEEDEDDFEDDNDQDDDLDDEFADDEADEDEFSDDEYDPLDDDDEEDDLIDADLEQELGYGDDDIDQFSMTAGERIGVAPGGSKTSMQPGLFNDEPVIAAQSEKTPRKPLFGGFSRKPRITAAPQLTPKSKVQSAAPRATRVAPVQESRRSKEAKEAAAETVFEKAPAEPSEVIVINVMAKAGRTLAGDDLLQLLITSGMKFGDMNIFHRRLGDSKGPVIFSIANILNPGTFDLNKMHEFSTLGVSLFLALPATIKNLDAFEQMLDVARHICNSLDGELRDDNRNLMTAQTIEHYRQRIRDFELRRLKAVGVRG